MRLAERAPAVAEPSVAPPSAPLVAEPITAADAMGLLTSAVGLPGVTPIALGMEPDPPPELLFTGPSPNGWHGHEQELHCDQYAAFADAGFHGEELPLVRGTLIHIGLAHHYRRLQAMQQGEDPTRFFDPPSAVEAAAAEMDTPLAYALVPLVQRVLRAYILRWAQVDRGFRVVAVEEIFSWAPGELIRPAWAPVRCTEQEYEEARARGVPDHHARFRAVYIPAREYTMRIDLCLRSLSSKRIFALDHKGTGFMGQDIAARYILSGQFLGITATGQRLWGDAFGGVRPNIIAFGATPSFDRPQLPPAPGALASFADTVQAAHVARELRRHGRRPLFAHTKRLSERICITPYGLCPHFERCRLGPR